jgi:hypothetical protein
MDHVAAIGVFQDNFKKACIVASWITKGRRNG